MAIATNQPVLLDRHAAAEYLGLSPRTIDAHVKEGELWTEASGMLR